MNLRVDVKFAVEYFIPYLRNNVYVFLLSFSVVTS